MFDKIQKLLIAVASLFLVTFPTSASAEVYIPTGFTVETLSVGDIHARLGGDKVEVYATAWDGKVFDLQFEGCAVNWSTNDPFYFIYVDDVGLFMTPVKTFDIFLKRSGMSFTSAMQLAIDNNQMCSVDKIWRV